MLSGVKGSYPHCGFGFVIFTFRRTGSAGCSFLFADSVKELFRHLSGFGLSSFMWNGFRFFGGLLRDSKG